MIILYKTTYCYTFENFLRSMIILYKQLFRPSFYSVKSFWRADVMKTCIQFSKTNFYFKFTWSLTLWFYTFKFSTIHSISVLVNWRHDEVPLLISILSRHSGGDIFFLTPVRDSQWSNIWSQQRIFECLFRKLCKTFESSVKINIPNFYDSNTLVPPVKLVLNIFVKYGNVFRKKYTSKVWHVYGKTVFSQG